MNGSSYNEWILRDSSADTRTPHTHRGNCQEVFEGGRYLGVKARILIGVTDVHWQARGRHQLRDAVVDEPVRVGRFLHAVFETGDRKGRGNNEWKWMEDTLIIRFLDFL